MPSMSTLQAEMDERIRRGQPLEDIEEQVIEPSELGDDDKSALWLYGWASREAGRARYAERQQRIRRDARDRSRPTGD